MRFSLGIRGVRSKLFFVKTSYNQQCQTIDKWNQFQKELTAIEAFPAPRRP